jgi:hypothetical protein
MSYLKRYTCFTLLLIFISCDSIENTDENEKLGSVMGFITMMLQNQIVPVENAEILVDSNQNYKALTDSEGRFEINGIPNGQHELLASYETGEGTIQYHTSFGLNNGNQIDLGTLELKYLGALQGKVTLESANNHSDIDVYIPGTSFIAKTDNEGNFIIFYIPAGRWTVKFSKSGYDELEIDDVEIKPSQITTLPAVQLTLPGSGSGEIIITANTTWKKAESPIIITSDIRVPSGIILTIEPGVEVRFVKIFDGYGPTDRADLWIAGMLYAEGTAVDSIIFTSNELNPGLEDWGCIKIGYDAYVSHSSLLSYCKIEYSTKGIWVDGLSSGKNLYVENCNFYKNSIAVLAGVEGFGHPTIEYCVFNNNETGILFGKAVIPDKIMHNDFYENDYGIIYQVPCYGHSLIDVEIKFNNLFDNLYNFYLQQTAGGQIIPSVDLTLNYWGYDTLEEIMETIRVDQGLEGYITIEPFSSEPFQH